jgi:hypothetical protein
VMCASVCPLDQLLRAWTYSTDDLRRIDITGYRGAFVSATEWAEWPLTST